MNTVNFKSNLVSLLDLSKRTVSKILRRANLKCFLCGWNDATCDVHHILSKKQGGSDSMDNLICVCPNCHRKIHNLGNAFKTLEELKDLSLDKTFSNWLDYYNPVSPLSYISIRSKLKNNCMSCGVDIPLDNIYCSITCSAKNRIRFVVTEQQILEFYDKKLSFKEMGKIFNVSDNAIRKRLKKMNMIHLFGRNRKPK